MRHGIRQRKLGRNPGHRRALLRNLMNALVRSERLVTTVAKAKELRPLAERLITLGKRNTLHARRRAFSLLSDKTNTDKLFSGLALRFAERAGGYTRIVRTGYRAGDGAEMAIIEYLPQGEQKTEPKKARKKKAAPKRVAGKKKTDAEKTAAKEKAAEAKPARKSPGKKKAAKPARANKAEPGDTGKPAAKPRGGKKRKATSDETP
ncbi:MAG: hypothetical protein Kow00128_11520 [Deltaproteobacteria bacterium]